ncbi:Ribosomal-protein-alanine acetyltransferase [gamma proteobacterium HdN1]|nr:Ribosomal-protein-alanine acetyltransferase [gamma proteobacterium HdN1]
MVEANRQVREMRARDLSEVLQIEQDSTAHPWTEALFVSCLEGDYLNRVLLENGQIIAFLVASVAVGECTILNICCAPSARRKGAASKLLRQVFKESIRLNAECAFLEVRRSNLGAIALYAGMGFEQVGVRKNYYPAVDGREDALVYRLDLTEKPEFSSV